MLDIENIKQRLRNIVAKRDYFFKDTSKADAYKFLESKTTFWGLSERDINGLEKLIDRKFPEDFKQYLSAFGQNRGDLFCGDDIIAEEIPEYQLWAQELFNKRKIPNFLTKNDCVFCFHQGYNFRYFDKEGAVYFYMEGRHEAEKVFNNFSELMEAELSKLEGFAEKNLESRGHFITLKNGVERREFPAQNEGIIPRQVGDQFPDESSVIMYLLKKLFS